MNKGEITKAISSLKQDVARWLTDVDSGRARLTLLEGIAAKAVNSFETVLRESFRFCLENSGISTNQFTDQVGKEKPLDKLTLGEIIYHLKAKNTDLARRFLMTPTTEARRVAALLTKEDIETLSKINELRRLLHHHREQFSEDEQALIKNSKAMLMAISKATATALFQIVARLQG